MISKVNSLPVFSIAYYCGRGSVRVRNEDCASVDGKPVEKEVISSADFSDGVDHMVLLADGMGGHTRGELASEMAITAINHGWKTKRDNFDPVIAIRAANADLYDAMEKDSSLRGMGATIVGAVFRAREMSWFNLGDSRGYLARDGILKQFTTDHVPRSDTTPGRRRSHTITQSIGGGHRHVDVWPAFGVIQLRAGDRVLFCSDGLTDAVDDNAVGEILQLQQHGERTIADLVAIVADRGAPDNISLLLVDLN